MVADAATAEQCGTKTRSFVDAFNGITNGIKSAAKWGSDKITAITSSKMYDKVLTGLSIGVAGFGSVIFAAEAVWALTFVVVAPIVALALFTCDVFLALFCLQLLSELIQYQMKEKK